MERMPPQETTANSTDAMFMSLVSSQRQFLSKLGVRTDSSWINMSNQSIIAPSLPPMPAMMPQDSLLVSKRLSLGIGQDSFVLPEPEFGSSDDSDDPFFSDDSDLEGGETIKRKMFDEPDQTPQVHVRAKRRRSTLTFLNYIFQTENEDVKKESTGDEGVAMGAHDAGAAAGGYTVKNEPKVEPSVYNRVEYLDSDDEDYGVVVEDVDNADEYERRNRVQEVTETIGSFESSMEAAQKSQQRIHDWDRKMGLKRSHSKTMRLSSRSRRKLRQICKKDLVILSKGQC